MIVRIPKDCWTSPIFVNPMPSAISVPENPKFWSIIPDSLEVSLESHHLIINGTACQFNGMSYPAPGAGPFLCSIILSRNWFRTLVDLVVG